MKKFLCLTLTLLFCFSAFTCVNAEENKWVVKPQYKEILGSDETGTIICVKKDEKLGYINNTGKTILDFQYDDANIFSAGLAFVEKDGKRGFIDKTGKTIIDLKTSLYKDVLKYPDNCTDDDYLYSDRFYGNYASVSASGQIFIIDINGNVKKTPIDLTLQGFAIVNGITITGKINTMGYGYINLNNNDSNISFYMASDFEDGFGAVDFGNGYAGIIDESFKVIYDKIEIGDNSSVFITNKYINITEYDDDFNAISSSLVDFKGKCIIPKTYTRLGEYSDGLIAAEIPKNNDYKTGYIDINNKWIIDAKYAFASNFKNGLAIVSEDYNEIEQRGTKGIIDTKGNYIIKPQFEDIKFDETSNLVYAKSNGLWGILDIKNQDVVTDNSLKFDVNDSPDTWAIPEVTKAIENKLVPIDLQSNYKSKITREEFCNLAISLIELKLSKTIDEILTEKNLSIQDNPFNDTTKKSIIVANKLGIVNGKGNGKFDPNGNITRQEAAVMLTNTAKIFNIDITSPIYEFSDKNNIEEWAKNAINYVAKTNVMKGTNIGFEPLSNYTRQQAFITIFRLLEEIK